MATVNIFGGGKENCLNSVKCDSSFTGRHFPQNSFLFSPKQAVMPLGHVKCSDTFKWVVRGSMTQYNFPVRGVVIVNCLKSTLYLQQLLFTNNLLAFIL